jgi:hypothetical protein
MLDVPAIKTSELIRHIVATLNKQHNVPSIFRPCTVTTFDNLTISFCILKPG